jgi:hypothetical protein
MNKKNRFRLNLTLILLIFSVILVIAAVPAVYAPSVHWWITSLADAHSSISPLGVTQVNNGLNQAYSFSANTGYYISSVLVDGSPVSTTSPYTFTDVLENHTIAVSSSPLVYTVSITFTSNPSGSGFITVNGVAEVTPYNIPSATVGATYTLDANSPVAGTTGVQYVFGSWGSTSIGTQTSASYVYTVPSTGETVTASYTTQYQLTVTSSYGSPTGAGWYNSGASATFGVTSPASVVSGQSQELFTSWTGSGTGSYSSTLTSTSVTMNNPITETAGWQLQYYLTVTGGNSVSGQGWVNSGTSTTASSSWVWNVVSGESRFAVTNLQLDGTNENPTRQDSGTLTTSSITMSTYHTVNFVFTTQYCLTVTGGNGVTYGAASPTGDNWYDSGMSTTVSSNGVWSRSGGTGQRVASWSLNGDGFVQQIENGGFESGTADWSGISGVASISSSYAHSGTYSLYLEPEDGSGVTQTISNIPVASVSSFNFWAIAPYGSVTTDWIKIFYTDGSSTTYYPSIPTSPWTEFSPTLTSGKTIDEIAFYSGDQSPIYIDDVSLQTFSATPTPVSTTGTVTISSVTMSTYNTIAFNDVTQYQVTLDAGATSALNSITSPTISGDNYWYDSGTSVSLVLNGVYGRSGGSGTRVSGYKINAGSNNPESTAGSISVLNTVSISGVEAVTTTTVTQYQVTLDSTSASALVSITTPTVGSDNYWYDSGTSVSVVLNGVWDRSGGVGDRLTGYVLNGGSNNPTSTTSAVTVFSGAISDPESVTATSVVQYFLTVNGGNSISYGAASTISGDIGWYDSGSSTTVSSVWVWGTSGSTRTALTNWNLDGGSNQNPARANSGALTTSPVTMSAVHTVNFISTTQYLLTVTGGNSISFGTASPTGDQWYDSGISTTVSSSWVWGTVSGQSRTALTNWQLDGTNENPSRQDSGTLTTSSVSMSMYYTVNFVSTTQYFLTVSGGNSVTYGTASPTSDNWYDSGSSTTVSSNWVWNVVSRQSRTAITNYAIDGSNQNPTRYDSSTLSTSSVTMSTYYMVSFSSVTQYYLTVSGGNGVTYGTASPTSDNWYDSGGSTTVSSNGVYSRSGGSGQRVASWNLDGGSNTAFSSMGTVTTSSVSMTTYHTINFNSVTQYQVTLDSGATLALNSITSPTVSGDTGWYDSGTSVSLVLNGVYGRSGGSGTRVSGYELNGGSNNPEATTGSFTVLNALSISGVEAVTTTTVTQYQITLDSTSISALNSITSPTVSGDNYWYDSGTSVSVVLNGVWGRSGGTGTGLAGYVLNGGSNNPTSTPSAVTVFSGAVSNHEFVTSTSVTQYQLMVTTNFGTFSPATGNWYDSGSSVTLSATAPTAGSGEQYVWNGWSGSGSGSYTGIANPAINDVTMNAPVTESGFWTNQYEIVPSVDSHSVISPSSPVWVNAGGSQTFTYSPNNGYSILSVLVDGGGVSITGSYTFSDVTVSHTISVSTAINVFYITASNDGNSVISPLGTTSVNYGGSQSYTFSANNGYNLTSVLVDGSPVSLSSPYTFTDVQANHTISASSISLAVFYITTFVDGHSTITPFGSIAVYDGYSQQFTFSASIGYHVVQVLVDGSPVSLSSPYTFSNVHANHTISVSSAIDVFYITSSSDGNSTISPLGLIAVNYGGNQSFSFSAISDYTLVGVLVDGSSVSLTSPYIFTNVQANHTISVRGALSLTPLGLSSSAPLPSGLTVQPIIIGKMQADSNGTVTINVAYGGGGGFTLTNIALPAPFVYWMTPTQSLPLTIINDQNVTFNIAVPKGFTGNLTGIATISGIDPYGKTELATTTISISIEPPSNSGSHLALFGTVVGTIQLVVGGIAAFTILLAVALLKKRK